MNPNLEDLVMAHRYLYYVKSSPTISDYEFDQLEKQARDTLPESSPVHEFGSDWEGSYTPFQKSVAEHLQRNQ